MQQTMNKDAEGYDDNMTDHDDGWDDTEEWLGEDHTILGKDALLPFLVMSESDLFYSYIKYGVFLTRILLRQILLVKKIKTNMRNYFVLLIL